jgi:hypothetical protein
VCKGNETGSPPKSKDSGKKYQKQKIVRPLRWQVGSIFTDVTGFTNVAKVTIGETNPL